MKAAQIAERITTIIETGNRMRSRALEYAKASHPDYRIAAECGGLSATVEALLEELAKLNNDVRKR